MCIRDSAWAALTVEAQEGVAGSTLEFYREALQARKAYADSAGEEVELVDLGDDVLTFRRGPLLVVLNCGTVPVELPDGEVVVASGPLGATLPPDTAAWLTVELGQPGR